MNDADRGSLLARDTRAQAADAAPGRGEESDAGDLWRPWMERRYDEYFASREYERRYPQPNEGTLNFLWRNGAHRASQVLDVGCGSGRYALPVLQRGVGQLVGCDISREAIECFSRNLAILQDPSRVRLVVGGLDVISREPRFDCMLMLFGVLSHIGPRAARVQALRELRHRLAPGGVLLLSVPSIWRRHPGAVVRSLGRRAAPGDIEYTRRILGQGHTFFYHLYSLPRLREDLAAGGWRVESAEAECLLPEWLVTQYRVFSRLDAHLQRLLPAALGYGIRVAARADASSP